MNKMIHRYTLLLILVLATSRVGAQIYAYGLRFGGIGEDVVKAMSVDDAGNTYLTGYFTDQADYDPGEGIAMVVSNGFYDTFVQKLDNEGNLIWVKSFGGPYFEYGTSVETDSEGNVYIATEYEETVDFDPGEGVFELTSSGAQDFAIVKLDVNGDFLWARGFGGEFYEEATSVGVDADGNVFLSGYFDSPGDYDPGEDEFILESNGGQDIFVVKLNADGEFLWAKNIGGPEQELSLGMDVGADGRSYMTGSFHGTVDFDPNTGTAERSAVDGSDGFILCLDTDGGFVYATVFGDTDNEAPYDVALDQEGNAIATGSFRGSFTAGEDTFSSVDNEDAFAVKVGPDGGFLWAAHVRGVAFQTFYDVNTDPSGNVFLAGYFSGTTDLDPADGSNFAIAPMSTEPFDAFLTALDPEGLFLYGAQFGGSNFLDHHGVDTDVAGNIYLSGAFQASVDIDPDPESTDTVSSAGFRDTYVIKLSAIMDTGLKEGRKEYRLSVFPNPATDKLTVRSKFPGASATYRMVDVSGRTVMSGNIGPANGSIEVSGLAPGIYVLSVDGHGAIQWVKR